jgi:uncharacterized protein
MYAGLCALNVLCINRKVGASDGRYTLDNAARIAEMKDRGFTEAREQLPEPRRHFFDVPAADFVPFHQL